MSITKASKHLGLKYSTAKLIVKRFKETGILYESKKAQQSRIKKENRENQLKEKRECYGVPTTNAVFDSNN
jgi:transposase